LLVLELCAQHPFRKVASQYRDQDQFFMSELNKRTIQLYLKDKQAGKEMKAVLENIDQLKVLSFTARNQDHVSNFIKEIGIQFDLTQYAPFKVKSTRYDNQLAYLKEVNEQIVSLMVVNTSLTKVSMVVIEGKIDLEKIVLLKDVLRLEGLQTLSNISEEREKPVIEKSPNGQQDKPSLLKQKPMIPGLAQGLPYNNSFRVYNKFGDLLMNTSQEPLLMVNGYHSSLDVSSSFSMINPNCIQSIHVEKSDEHHNTKGLIDIILKDDINELFTVCEGTLYFGQNGYIQLIDIDDECSPALLHDCKKKPLSAILQLEQDEIKTIRITNNPMNCDGILEGTYIVVESK
jgi:hypothetical protein